jgi:hypothetical protein
MKAMPQSPNEPKPDDLNARIDDLSRRVDNGFNRVDAKLESQGEAIARLEAQAESTAAELKRKDISEGFQRMQRLMIEVGGGIVITLLVASRLFV